MMVSQMKKVNIGNEIIAYREAGKGKRNILLIHGNMTSSLHLNTLIDELKDEVHIIAPDLRGFGESSYNESFDSLEELARDIKTLLERIDFNDFDVLGWSTGGGVALHLAALVGNKIGKIYLLDSVGIKGYQMYKKDESLNPIVGEYLKTKKEIENDPVQVKPVLDALKNKDKAFYKYLWELLIYNNGNIPDESIYDSYLDDMLTQKNLVDIDYSLTRFNISKEHNGLVEGSNLIDRINQEVIIIHGENDMVVPVSEAYYSDKNIKNSRLEIITKCGHSPLVDALDKVVKIIKGD